MTEELDPSQLPGSARIDGDAFRRDGYAVLRSFVGERLLAPIDALLAAWNRAPAAPLELEADVGYRGAPDRDGPGGGTVRRFLAVYERDGAFGALLAESGLLGPVARCLGAPPRLVLAHHNCVMTKAPRHSSDTPWHRDLRYWSFSEGELVTAWIALGEETSERGGLHVVPGSHRVELPDEAFDADRSLRPDARIAGASRPIRLARGDVLLFHCRLLHSASRNHTDEAKSSVVFTFRRASDRPLPGSRSESGGDVPADRIGSPRRDPRT